MTHHMILEQPSWHTKGLNPDLAKREGDAQSHLYIAIYSYSYTIYSPSPGAEQAARVSLPGRYMYWLRGCSYVKGLWVDLIRL